MSIPLLSGKKTIALVADDAMYVYSTAGGKVSLVGNVPWTDDAFFKKANDLLVKKCKSAPVLFLNDMVEQHYRKEKIVKSGANAMDKANIIKRKINVAFPGYPAKGAYPLKEKIQKTANQLAADIYIFSALPDSEQFSKTVGVARTSHIGLSGLGLLPVESSDMVKKLCSKIAKNKDEIPKWAVFVGQHKNGSLRQIVTKNGELALTRMTPISDGSEDFSRWAGEVNQELKATMSYLSRFGYSPEDGLNIIVISDSQSEQVLSAGISEDADFHALTVSEAARLLQLKIGRQEDQRHADPLHVAWAAKKQRYILPLKSVKFDEVSKPRKLAFAASALLSLGGVFFSYLLFNQLGALSDVKGKLASSKSQQVMLRGEHQSEVDKKNELGIDILLVQSSITVHSELEKQNLPVIPLFLRVAKAAGPDMRIDKVSVEKYEEDLASKFSTQNINFGNDENNKTPLFKTALTLTYPSTTNIQIGNSEVNDLSDRIGASLENYDVVVSKLLKDYEYTEGLVIEAGDLKDDSVTQDFIAQIDINGPMIEDTKKW